MKYVTALLTAGLISITFTVDAEAQILNRLKKKAQATYTMSDYPTMSLGAKAKQGE